ncbi:hypothetical protein LTR16_009322, partial [Cryomyces antarcticus]
MKVSSIAVLAVAAVPALAQNLSSLPTCAQTCAAGGITSTGCALTDFKCICSASTFLDSVASCISTACSPADQQ